MKPPKEAPFAEPLFAVRAAMPSAEAELAVDDSGPPSRVGGVYEG
ncbi:MAG: hypothetical protein ACSHYB_07530 [Roseibacillus sp.]